MPGFTESIPCGQIQLSTKHVGYMYMFASPCRDGPCVARVIIPEGAIVHRPTGDARIKATDLTTNQVVIHTINDLYDNSVAAAWDPHTGAHYEVKKRYGDVNGHIVFYASLHQAVMYALTFAWLRECHTPSKAARVNLMYDRNAGEIWNPDESGRLTRLLLTCYQSPKVAMVCACAAGRTDIIRAALDASGTLTGPSANMLALGLQTACECDRPMVVNQLIKLGADYCAHCDKIAAEHAQ